MIAGQVKCAQHWVGGAALRFWIPSLGHAPHCMPVALGWPVWSLQSIYKNYETWQRTSVASWSSAVNLAHKLLSWYLENPCFYQNLTFSGSCSLETLAPCACRAGTKGAAPATPGSPCNCISVSASPPSEPVPSSGSWGETALCMPPCVLAFLSCAISVKTLQDRYYSSFNIILP